MKNLFKTLLIAATLFTVSMATAQEGETLHVLQFVIVDVYDGDTIKTEVPLPPPLNKISIRIAGIDTPERKHRAKCENERVKAEEAKKFLQGIVSASDGIMYVANFKWGKYGGRIVGDVYIAGIDIKKAMIDNGYAIPYDGGTKLNPWCARHS